MGCLWPDKIQNILSQKFPTILGFCPIGVPPQANLLHYSAGATTPSLFSVSGDQTDATSKVEPLVFNIARDVITGYFKFLLQYYVTQIVFNRWLWIFLSLKSPEEWVITKQACRDKSVVFFLFFNIYCALLQCIEHSNTEKSDHIIPTYIHTYTLFILEIFRVAIKKHKF